jgi:hypothetical protein
MGYDHSHSPLTPSHRFTNVLQAPAKASIEIQKVTYTSAFRYNATSKTYYREFDPGDQQYVGTPAPQIDKAWEELLAGTPLRLFHIRDGADLRFRSIPRTLAGRGIATG